MAKITEKQIAKDLAELINSKVRQLEDSDQKWKELYSDAIYELERQMSNARDAIKYYKESNLTINAVEQEGYLRGMITMLNYFKFLQEQFIENEKQNQNQ
jgi:alanine dehydrogenase